MAVITTKCSDMSLSTLGVCGKKEGKFLFSLLGHSGVANFRSGVDRTCFDANERKMNHCVLASSYFSISCSSRWPFIAQHTSLTEAKSVLARSNSSIIGHFLAFFPSQWTKPSLLLCLFFIRAVLHLIARGGSIKMSCDGF